MRAASIARVSVVAWVCIEKRRSGERKTVEKRAAARWRSKKELNSFPRH